MPHKRSRHLLALLNHFSKISPLIGVLGHRQVGKTTLLESVSARYLSFDDEETMAEATQSPKRFLQGLTSLATAIDECQLVESVFPALKERVRVDKRPGQFYLSGSVRFTSKKLIHESLTGRILTADLLPLTLSELDHQALPDKALQLLRVKSVRDLQWGALGAKEHSRRMAKIAAYEQRGGLPGACFLRDPKMRAQKLMSQLETILNRDLRQIHDTTLPLPDLIRFLRQVSLLDGQPINHEELRRTTGITPITQKKLFYALESVFILRALPIEGSSRGSAIFFEDHAEVAMLAQNRLSPERRWDGLIYRNLREQFMYRVGENAEFFQFRTRAGVVVPFAVRTDEAVLGFIPVHGPMTRTAVAASQSFLRSYGGAHAILVTDQDEMRVLDDRTLVMPATQLLWPDEL